MSVTSGVQCIDFRKFFKAKDGNVKPTRIGIAIRIPEWERFKEITREMKEQHPKIAESVPCWTQSDHFNQEGFFQCKECNPFGIE